MTDDLSRGDAPQPVPVSNVAQPPEVAYEIGYKRPPRHHCFKPGQSGNPRGRPRKPVDLASALQGVLFKQTKVRTAGGAKSMMILEALLHKLTENAFKGDLKSIKLLIDLLERQEKAAKGKNGDDKASDEDMSATDVATLAALRAGIASELGGGHGLSGLES